MTDAPDPIAVVRPLLRARQVRQFTEVPPTDAQLHALTEVARWSGSSRNAQPWRFVTIRSLDTLRALSAAGQPQLRSLVSATAAIAIVLPVAEGSIADEYTFDEGRAAERILVAANWLGLGAAIAWVLPAVRPVVAQHLGLPADRFVRTIVALGNPTEAAQQPKSAPGQARVPREESVREERWG